MRPPLCLIALACGLALLAAPPARSGDGPAAVAHRLEVTLDPEAGTLAVTDEVTLPEAMAARAGEPIRLRLHGGLRPTTPTSGARLELEGSAGPLPVESWRLTLPAGARRFTLAYEGKIVHPLRANGTGRGQEEGTPGLISSDGVYLSGGTCWYPQLGGGDLVTFSMTVRLPAGWTAVSQGAREASQDGGALTRWACAAPQDDVYLIAARFVVTERREGDLAVMAYLRSDDPDLAARYLDVTARYVRMYEGLIGKYPYGKFAVVENFWETGYGMPSFTLLGGRVMRLPFILHSSYPHEILHNWWGNGVFVDPSQGNWCEGLTAYLADHLIKEQQGEGEAYRRTSLQAWADYAAEGRDRPLSAFRARHDKASQAVGYGKCLMALHMIRRRMGDAAFARGLAAFYRDHRFTRASFGDLAAAMSAAAGEDLRPVFAQWVERAGAPQLRLGEVRAEKTADGWRLATTIEQTQPGEPYDLRVPVAVDLEGEESAFETSLAMRGARLEVALDLPARPVRFRLDPRFDLFRKLDRAEVPPALSQLFGAERPLVVVPADASAPLADAHRALALGLAGRRAEVVTDREIDALPEGRAVWLLGWRNRFAARAREAARGLGGALEGDAPRVGGTAVRSADHSLAVVVGGAGGAPIGWVATDRPAAAPGLARKLPHYGKYSFLLFEGDEPANVEKGQWTVVDSPTSIALDPRAGAVPARLAPRAALAELPASGAPPAAGDRAGRRLH